MGREQNEANNPVRRVPTVPRSERVRTINTYLTRLTVSVHWTPPIDHIDLVISHSLPPFRLFDPGGLEG